MTPIEQIENFLAEVKRLDEAFKKPILSHMDYVAHARTFLPAAARAINIMMKDLFTIKSVAELGEMNLKALAEMANKTLADVAQILTEAKEPR